MEVQKQILLFFSGLHTDFLNLLAQFITVFGEEFIIIATAVFIYWNISKKHGFVICMSLLNALTAMGVVKAIVRFPRPWTVIDGLDPVRQHTATGYSFPSGHTTCAASAYSAVAVSFRKRWLSVVCAAAILLVGLSRVFLCVHWPMDVLGGIVIGCGISLVCSSLFGRLFDDREKSIRVTKMLCILCTLATVVVSVLLVLGKIDDEAFNDLNITFAVYGGLALGYIIERKHCDFVIEEGRIGLKILRYAVGMAVVAVILFGLKAVFNALGIYNPATRALRYYLVGVWGCLFPLVGSKLKLFEAGEARE
ncbi:MAG: phosphatase PAP2 family protein [Spirochaetales bacterium]|nr:phosphatase PAP2 family protein [Spirochaetales bacterium]MBR6348193.1 phosphatase PAP2 family protein [Spirochaetales bacterium]